MTHIMGSPIVDEMEITLVRDRRTDRSTSTAGKRTFKTLTV